MRIVAKNDPFLNLKNSKIKISRMCALLAQKKFFLTGGVFP